MNGVILNVVSFQHCFHIPFVLHLVVQYSVLLCAGVDRTNSNSYMYVCMYVRMQCAHLHCGLAITDCGHTFQTVVIGGSLLCGCVPTYKQYCCFVQKEHCRMSL